MRSRILAVLVVFISVLAACGDGGQTVDIQPQFGLRFECETDNEGCPVDQKETNLSGYERNYIPSDIASLNFALASQTGQVLVESSVNVASSCDDPYSCILPNAQGYKLFNVPTLQNMSLEVKAFNSSDQLVWVGNNADVDISVEQTDPNTEAVRVDIYMRRISRITKAFNCMGTERFLHTATELRNGDILIVGGGSIIRQNACPSHIANGQPCDLIVANKLVTLYDHETGEFIEMTPLNEKRAAHQTILLKDGRVLIMGGAEQVAMLHSGTGEVYLAADTGENGGNGVVHSTAVIYNPNNVGKVEGSPLDMGTARMDFTVTPVDSEIVGATHFLIAGGWGAAGRHTQLQMVDFEPNSMDEPFFRILPHALNAGRAGHTATRVNGGQVFIYGGADPGDPAAELFLNEKAGVEVPSDISGQWGSLPMLHHHAAGSFDDEKKVLVTGGLSKIAQGDSTRLKEDNTVSFIFDLDARTTEVIEDQLPRSFHTISSLPDGSLIIAGGAHDVQLSEERLTVELFNIKTGDIGTLKDNGGADIKLGVGRMGHTANVLSDYSVVFIGGAYPDASDNEFPTNKIILRSGESYMPDVNNFVPAGSDSESDSE